MHLKFVFCYEKLFKIHKIYNKKFSSLHKNIKYILKNAATKSVLQKADLQFTEVIISIWFSG